jgi:hypothetical protein
MFIDFIDEPLTIVNIIFFKLTLISVYGAVKMFKILKCVEHDKNTKFNLLYYKIDELKATVEGMQEQIHSLSVSANLPLPNTNIHDITPVQLFDEKYQDYPDENIQAEVSNNDDNNDNDNDNDNDNLDLGNDSDKDIELVCEQTELYEKNKNTFWSKFGL